MRKINLSILFLVVSSFVSLFAKTSWADFDPRNIKEVVLVRGAKMPVCPYGAYDETTKSRIKDSTPYYSMMEFMKLHPDPMIPPGSSGCKELLYGQIELVPFGKEPTYIPTEFIYVFDNTIIREARVLTSESTQFSDEKLMYKKVLSFAAIDSTTGNSIELPDTVFWFRGNEVYGRISDVMEGVLEYKGTYYRHDGAQIFINQTVIWQNPGSNAVSKDFSVYQATTSSVPIPPVQESLPYPTPITNWKNAVFSYGTEAEDRIYPSDLLTPNLPANQSPRFVAYRFDLPTGLASTAGLIARFKTCANDDCSQSYEQAIFITDKDGNRLSQTFSWDISPKVVDLNTDYFRTNRTIYLVFGTSRVPNLNGIRYRYFYGNIANAPAPGATSRSDWKTFNGPINNSKPNGLNVTLTYPPNLVSSYIGSEGNQTLAFGPNSQSGQTVTSNFALVIGTQSLQSQTLQAYADATTKPGSSAALTERRTFDPVVVGGLTGYKYSGASGGNTILGVFLQKGDQVIGLTVFYVGNDNPDFDNQFDSILGSVRITQP